MGHPGPTVRMARRELAALLGTFKNGLIAVGRRLPSRVRKSLFHFAYNCAPDEFEKFSHMYGYASSQNYPLKAISSRGFSPKVVVDVGAYQGQWSMMVRSIWPGCDIIMIEPNIEQRERLQSIAAQLNATLHTELLGAENGQEVKFHLMGSGSSVFPERSDVPRKSEIRRLRTLNSILGGDARIDLLKIDAQGYELQILAGGDAILPKVQAVILEVSLIEVNERCPMLHEVISYMYDRGFVAYEVLELHRRPLDGALFQMDIFFCRELSTLREDKRFCSLREE
jgi:FkbM family methyltransferase